MVFHENMNLFTLQGLGTSPVPRLGSGVSVRSCVAPVWGVIVRVRVVPSLACLLAERAMSEVWGVMES